MNYAKIEICDVVNGPGVRTTLFVSGCAHNCVGCHNKEAQNFKFGEEFTDEVSHSILSSLDNEFIDGLSISGGDPLHPKNTSQIYELVKKVRARYSYKKSIWLWTGYTIEQLRNRNDSVTDGILKSIDVLIDGKFVKDLKEVGLRYRGSSNQKIINLAP